MSQWQQYCDKFLTITPREQYLIVGTGLFVAFFMVFNLYLENAIEQVGSVKREIRQAQSANLSAATTIGVLEEALKENPNVAIEKNIKQKTLALAKIDERLLELTTDLIDPVQMRGALMELLSLQKGVSLVSFEAMPSVALTQPAVDKTAEPDAKATQKVVHVSSEGGDEASTMVLYKHGMRLTLSGSYFQLRDYLTQVEELDWRFFWQSFQYELVEYPKSQLVIEIYSLSTNKEFIGV